MDDGPDLMDTVWGMFKGFDIGKSAARWFGNKTPKPPSKEDLTREILKEAVTTIPRMEFMIQGIFEMLLQTIRTIDPNREDLNYRKSMVKMCKGYLEFLKQSIDKHGDRLEESIITDIKVQIEKTNQALKNLEKTDLSD